MPLHLVRSCIVCCCLVSVYIEKTYVLVVPGSGRSSVWEGTCTSSSRVTSSLTCPTASTSIAHHHRPWPPLPRPRHTTPPLPPHSFVTTAHTDDRMEHLSLHDAGPQAPGAPPMQQGPPPVPQLPPQMFTTAAQLLDLTDKKLLLSLRDGRKLIGVLRSWDQFGNLVLQDTVERLFVQNFYADIERGLFLVRGENVLLLGEIDLDKDDYVPPPFELAPVEKVFALKKQEDQDRKKSDKSKQKKLAELGFVLNRMICEMQNYVL
ncbi:U6 snRNA-associated Sm-like protein LSm1 [Fulvia fulva]|uniref:U6 snRNA-associated Sm-like protein LSm1 n=1 Tax=Passalora fulva TaxID=5499 RepID=A0A9Q8P3N8_PASFU|nr:U6 snRNA-associated Sm-like protein LSm1 [Fulvia fulva]KAK4635310.1 U6 snRNA-associated Sm-like protein LSm1 [Fulvia fulva]KAK4638048.1 U6 snRNA-associated Sm-like protein LSm1 [Fulvia fulva]UJO11956.1 U6 snRNA-associated Sm-like protein LSm1 [Fulvia fulva]WPV08653.1 U6 snRNA-associated Sm-like protein LSm1 [Fulvia fulva]WPV24649.1 U6 snRNA-associated Sm-like protein LSm1 [Fulvia fulva]